MTHPPIADQLDVLIFGGGVAGLWTLHRLRAEGWRVLLVEAHALGRGQTIPSQGIIHGGGKYALRGVRDFAAVRAIRDMPARWRSHLRGETMPDLSAVQLLSDHCLLWLPRGSLLARMQAAGGMRVVEQAGLLATRPRRLDRSLWPPALRGSAVGVYDLAEPVLHTGSLVRALAAAHPQHIRSYAPARPGVPIDVGTTPPGAGPTAWTQVRVRPPGGDAVVTLRPRAVVLTAGEGNAELLACAGAGAGRMQRRPVHMVLLRGVLPRLYGHCVLGGKTRLTVTSVPQGDQVIWQVGGELSERLADEDDPQRIQAQAMAELRRCLPGVDLRGAGIASYRAVRAEARDARERRPSGVHVGRVAGNVVVGWPTKLALAPLLAEAVCVEVRQILSDRAEVEGPGTGRAGAHAAASEPATGGPPTWHAWPAPSVARAPWEEASWTSVP